MDFEELVFKGKYQEAFEIVSGFSIPEILQLLNEFPEEKLDLTSYGFLIYLLLNLPVKVHSKIHYNAAVLLGSILIIIEGSYQLAHYHLCMALSKEPNNEQYNHYLKHLNSMPY